MTADMFRGGPWDKHPSGSHLTSLTRPAIAVPTLEEPLGRYELLPIKLPEDTFRGYHWRTDPISEEIWDDFYRYGRKVAFSDLKRPAQIATNPFDYGNPATEVKTVRGANLVSSALIVGTNGDWKRHRPVLDIDIPHRIVATPERTDIEFDLLASHATRESLLMLFQRYSWSPYNRIVEYGEDDRLRLRLVNFNYIPSSTKGHAHLYLTADININDYLDVLKILARVGVIEEAYYRSAIGRGATMVRLPWVKKGGPLDNRTGDTGGLPDHRLSRGRDNLSQAELKQMVNQIKRDPQQIVNIVQP